MKNTARFHLLLLALLSMFGCQPLATETVSDRKPSGAGPGPQHQNGEQLHSYSPVPASIRFLTEPPGGELVLERRKIRHGETLELLPGRHVVTGHGAGLRPGRTRFEVRPGEVRTVVVELEPALDAAGVTSALDQAEIPVSGLAVDPEAVDELRIGERRATIGHSGSRSYKSTSSLPPDHDRQVNVAPESRPAPNGSKQIDPREAEFARDRHFFGGMAPYKFASHQRKAKVAASISERRGKAEFRPKSPQPWLQGEWLEAEIAVRAEHHVYKDQPTGGPLDERSRQAGMVSENDPRDRLSIPTISSNRAPMIDLDKKLLAAAPQSGMTLHVTEADLPVEILAHGDMNLQLDNRLLATDAAGAIKHEITSAGTVELRWDVAPERLLVMPAAGLERGLDTELSLLSGEKRLRKLATNRAPVRMIQITHMVAQSSPPRWQQFEADTGFGVRIDLRRLELGPHRRPGQYQRLWILEYEGPEGTTQRQFSSLYSVSKQQLKPDSDLFLRRAAEQDAENN